MAKSTYLESGQADQTHKVNIAKAQRKERRRRKKGGEGEREKIILPGGLALSKLNGAADRASVQPSVGVNTQGLTRELPKLGRPLNGLEQRKEP